MKMQFHGEYRMEGRHLYKKQGRSFIHVYTVPPSIKGIQRAIADYERNTNDDEAAR